MKTVLVNLKDNPYKIIIGHGILPQLGAALKSLKMGRDAVIITQPVIRRWHGPALAAGLARNGFHVKFF